MPKVSVITPIYNTPKDHLRETIDSILNQTFTDFEYIILNDSPDNTELDEIVASYTDSRIRYYRNKKNIGLEESTNKLLDLAKGEYVAVFDHDDISLPDRLKKEVEYLDYHPDVGLVSGQFTIFGIQNSTSNNPIKNDDIKKKLETESCVSHTTAMFRKSVLDKNNIRYEKEFFPAASYRIITKTALVTKVHNLPDILLRYRMDGNNTSIKHANQRVKARKQLRKEYVEAREAQYIKELFDFDTVTVFHTGSQEDTRYYKAKDKNGHYFVKAGVYSYEHEFDMAKKVYEKDHRRFAKPINFQNGDVNFYVTEWTDGIELNEFIKKDPTKSQKIRLIDELQCIHKALKESGIVHRDIIPRNFMVVDNNCLVLLDFYWAVEKDNYQEYEYIKDEVRDISLLGESFAAGVFMWDDAFSLVKIAQYILGNTTEDNPSVKKLSREIGKVVIRLSGEILNNTIEKRYRKIAELNDKVLELEKINNELSQNINGLRNTIREQQGQIHAIKTSNSWKLTKPVRFITKIFK